jgi:hypothetical protein
MLKCNSSCIVRAFYDCHALPHHYRPQVPRAYVALACWRADAWEPRLLGNPLRPCDCSPTGSLVAIPFGLGFPMAFWARQYPFWVRPYYWGIS